jgi:hypothetical protein
MADEPLSTPLCVAWGVIGAAYAAICIWLGVRLFNRRERWVKWTSVALAITPVLYVLSSGPMTMVAFHTRITMTPSVLPDGTSALAASGETSFGRWFPTTYAPLFWSARHPWGEPLFWYWDQFPHQHTVVKP